jgi:hypothetical protein
MDGSGSITVTPADNGAVLKNPSMGWVLHFYDNTLGWYGTRLAPEDTLDDFPGLNVVYLRVPWAYLEPRRGQFNWALLDGPAQRFIAKGMQAAYRFSCCEGHSGIVYGAPQWVEDAGAKGHWFTNHRKDGIRYWEPDYADPIFLEHLERFLDEAARRFDGNDDVAFFDVGSYGIWGEGHTYHSTKIASPPEVIEKHIELHQKYFKKTLIAINDDSFASAYGKTPEPRCTRARYWASQGNFTLRDDSIMVSLGKLAYKSADLAQPFWPNQPVILESEHYGGAKHRGSWGDGSKYIEAMEVYHASYVSVHWWPREFLRECGELITAMNRRLGYRLRLLEASWPAEMKIGGAFPFAARWANAGVAPCYPGGHPAVTFKNANGGIVAVFADEAFNVRGLPVAPADKPQTVDERAEFIVPQTLAPGDYGVFVSVGSPMGTPRIALPLDGDDGQRRYLMGRVKLTAG